MDINDIPARGDLEKIILRFESRYIPEPMSGCWLWFGACDAKLYGKMNLGGGVYVKAHRLAFVLYNGPLLHNACHHCNNPACVNPDHLFDGTRSENTKDSWDKGRREHIQMPRGEAAVHSKLSADQVVDIRRRLGGGDLPARIAPDFGVSAQAVYAIRDGAVWRHLLAAESVLLG